MVAAVVRLMDLDPQWLLWGHGRRIGVTFLCPHCYRVRIGVSWHKRGHEVMEDRVVRARMNGDPEFVGFVWKLTSKLKLDRLSLEPGIEAPGHWHGAIKRGEMRGA